jgi:DNA replication protein DnaC
MKTLIRKLPECFYLVNGYAVECERHLEWRLSRIGRAKMEAGGFQGRWFDYDPDRDYVGKVPAGLETVARLKKYVENWPRTKDAVIYLGGANGTQKTTLASWMAARISRLDDVAYVRMGDLVRELNDQFDDEAIERCARLASVGFLVIDEAFDREKTQMWTSGKQLPALESFLKRRVEDYGLGMVFISNQSISDVKKNGFSESIANFVEREVAKRDGAMWLFDRYDTSRLAKVKLF